mmetsp:Transcript_16339/g.26509  ORF Transcript_16339/g.26509 Transcript_16339/m.26509 type:complete len:385 (-) Transcript_16339:26-1180(-)
MPIAPKRLQVVLALASSGIVFAVLEHVTDESTCEKQDSIDVSAFLQSRPSISRRKEALKEDDLPASFVDRSVEALSGILHGTTGKEDVELVLADYDEDLHWSDAYQHIRTIYCKGPRHVKQAKSNGCIPLRNVGREGHTFLHHIVENYDKLSKWTVFTQAGVPTPGYKGHRAGGGHMLPGVSFDSYLLDEDAGGLPRDDGTVFVFTGAVHMGTLNHSLRFSYLHATEAPNLHSPAKCPQAELLDGWQRWWDLGWFKKWIGGKCGKKAKELPAFFNKYWDEYVKLPRPENDVVFFTQGARFAASRERIRQRPKEDYVRMLDLLSKEEDPCHNYLNEWIWYYMIGKPTAPPCSTTLLTYEGNKDESWVGPQSVLEELQAKRLPRYD